MKRCGFTHAKSTRVQRYKCKACGRTYSRRPRKFTMNRLPDATVQYAMDLFRNGNSVRNVARMTGMHTLTAQKIMARVEKAREERRAKLKVSRENRNRPGYLGAYRKAKPYMTSEVRHERNDRLRAHIGLFLVKSPRPMSLNEIYHAMLKDYPDLVLCALSYMLNRNVEETFKKVGTDHWAYKPSPWFFPVLHTKFPERDEARAIWFKRYGIKDEMTEPIIEKLLAQQKERLIQKRVQVAEAIRPLLETMAAFSDIAKLTNTQNERHH